MLTDVSDVDVVGERDSIVVKCNADLWGRGKTRHSWSVTSSQHFACCGMRTMQGMDVFALSEEFQTIGFCRKLRDAMEGWYFRGGNVSFVLNPTQRKKLETLLKNMNRVGAGITEIPFPNKNMRHPNYLYIWTYRGRKPKKTAIVQDIPASVANATVEN